MQVVVYEERSDTVKDGERLVYITYRDTETGEHILRTYWEPAGAPPIPAINEAPILEV